MATHCSPGALFLLLSTPLVHGAYDVKTACQVTPYPEYCATVLSASPESKAADERGLTGIAIRATAKLAATAAAFARDMQKKVPEGQQWCMEHCTSDIKNAASHLGDGTKLVAMGHFITRSEMDSVVWNCDECKDVPVNKGPFAPVVETLVPATPRKADLISKGSDFEKIMGVVAALIKHATGSAMAPAASDLQPLMDWRRAPAPGLTDMKFLVGANKLPVHRPFCGYHCAPYNGKPEST